jgi:WD40 repeat protein
MLTAATVGADNFLHVYDLRNTKNPLWSNNESKSILMSCDFMPNDQQILTTSINGEISVFSVKRQQRVLLHETLPELIRKRDELRAQVIDDYSDDKENKKEISNILYSVTSVKGLPDEEGTFLVGGEDQNILKIQISYDGTKIIDTYSGSSKGIKMIEFSRDG